MALKAKITKLEDVAEELRALYRKDGDVFVLDVGDDLADHPSVGPLARALAREKTANAESKAAQDALEEKFKGLDPEAARAALKAAEDAGDQTLIAEGKMDEVIEQRTERMRKEFADQLAAKDAALEKANESGAATIAQLAEISIFGAVKDAALSKGARKEALQDVTNRAREVWRMEEGKPVARNGEDLIYGKQGEALTVEEWVDTLSTEAAYLFEPSKGGGAGGGDGAGNRGGNSGDVKLVSPEHAGDNIAGLASGEVQINR